MNDEDRRAIKEARQEFRRKAEEMYKKLKEGVEKFLDPHRRTRWFPISNPGMEREDDLKRMKRYFRLSDAGPADFLRMRREILSWIPLICNVRKELRQKDPREEFTGLDRDQKLLPRLAEEFLVLAADKPLH